MFSYSIVLWRFVYVIALTCIPFWEKKETGRVVIGGAWEGPCTPERLPGKLQAADKKEEQHLAFSERDQESVNSVPFDASIFVQPFISFFVILAKFLVIIDRIFYSK